MNRSTIGIFVFVVCIAIGFFVVQHDISQTQDDIKATQVLMAESQVAQAEATRRGCERTNARLKPVYDFFGDAVRKLRSVDLEAADSPEARAAILISIEDFQHRANAMVEAVADVPKYEGSAEVNCDGAFPLPPRLTTERVSVPLD